MHTRSTLALPLIAIAAIATPARADSTQIGGGRTAIVEVGQPHRVPSALDSVPHPWPGTALSLSAIGAALPVAIAARPNPHSNNGGYFYAMLGAEIVTPAAGHLYAGLNQRAVIGMATRAAGVAIAAGGHGAFSASEFTNGALAVVFGTTMV